MVIMIRAVHDTERFNISVSTGHTYAGFKFKVKSEILIGLGLSMTSFKLKIQ